MYYILEIQEQRNGTGAVVTPIQTADIKNEALSKYHGVLMYAAISNVFKHTVLMIDGSGQSIAKETYTHYSEEEDNANVET